MLTATMYPFPEIGSLKKRQFASHPRAKAAKMPIGSNFKALKQVGLKMDRFKCYDETTPALLPRPFTPEGNSH